MSDAAPTANRSPNPSLFHPDAHSTKLTILLITSVITGLGTGLIAVAFRWVLDHGSSARNAIIAWAHGFTILGFIGVIVIAGVMCALAASIVRLVEPHAEGSGIPHVEAVVEGRSKPASLWLVPVKFVGGVLAIGAGLPLGREGPSVQMGAGVAHIVANLFRRSEIEARVLFAAAAGAGLAAAFNAPLAGGIFVLEELMKRFEARTMIAVLATSASSITVVHLVLGSAPVLQAPEVPPFSMVEVLPALAVGVLAAVLGVFYNKAIMGALRVADSIRLPVELRAGIIGALVGAIAWFAPGLVGGGDNITEDILNGRHTAVMALVAILALRFVLGVLAYSAGTPGGLFAPMLVLGSASGAIVGCLAIAFLPGVPNNITVFAVMGMAAFFTASVRAPVTGMILAIEMTGAVSAVAPMLIACGVAMFIETLVHNEPIYDALTRRSVINATKNVQKRQQSERQLT